MENFNCSIRFAKGYNLNVLIQNVHEKIKIGKNFTKGFNLKVHLQNVHEIEKISTKPKVYEPINDIMEIIGTLRNTKFKCRICEKEMIEKINFKMHIEMSIEDLKKYKCDDYGKNFTQNMRKKDSIVMNVANIFIENPI